MSANNWTERDGILYDQDGSIVSVAYKSFAAQRVKNAITNEKEENFRLSAEDREKLSKYPHALDYQFSEEQIQFLEDNGYLVIPNFFSEELVEKMVDQIYVRAKQLAGLERDNISTWQTSGVNQGFLDLWHLPAYYELRQDPRLYSVFAQILNDPKLTVSLDRVSIKTPAWLEIEENGQTKKLDFSSNQRALQIHTDLNLWYLNCMSYQGSICLSDCPVGSGGFTCMPGYHKLNKIRPYRVNYELGGFQGAFGQVRRSPPEEESVFEFYEDKEAIARDLKEIPMKKGDFLIWSSRLPHGNAKNISNRWRLQCFVRCVTSAEDKKQIYRNDVRESVQSGLKPLYFSSGSTTTPYYREWEVPYHQPVQMTDLGKKLFGFEDWK